MTWQLILHLEHFFPFQRDFHSGLDQPSLQRHLQDLSTVPPFCGTKSQSTLLLISKKATWQTMPLHFEGRTGFAVVKPTPEI